MPIRKCYQGNVEPLYIKYFDNYRMKSNILKGLSTMTMNLSDKRGLQIELDQLIGAKDGKYLDNSFNLIPAAIPGIEKRLRDLENEFRGYQQERINMGVRKPENWPSDMKEKKLKLEARLDTYAEEVTWLKKAIASIVEVVEESRDVLRFGCQQMGRLRAGILCELDGQRITVNENGILVIDDDQSPYDGLAVPDYRDRVCPVFRAMEKEKDATLLLRLQAEARQWNRPIPNDTPFTSMRTVPKSSLPPWPAGVKNWKGKTVEPEPAIYAPKVMRRHVPKEIQK